MLFPSLDQTFGGQFENTFRYNPAARWKSVHSKVGEFGPSNPRLDLPVFSVVTKKIAYFRQQIAESQEKQQTFQKLVDENRKLDSNVC